MRTITCAFAAVTITKTTATTSTTSGYKINDKLKVIIIRITIIIIIIMIITIIIIIKIIIIIIIIIIIVILIMFVIKFPALPIPLLRRHTCARRIFSVVAGLFRVNLPSTPPSSLAAAMAAFMAWNTETPKDTGGSPAP